MKLRFKNKLYSFVSFCLLSFVLIYSCKESTSPQTTTFSGTVTLADTSDYSGVEVMLFKPVEIDTALLNLNKNYPGVGIELNQKTEFYWREQEPVYTTTTDVQGRWQIKNVEVGTYHIVYKKDGYGWRVQYDANGKEDYNISLKKAIVWQGTYNEAVMVPQNSFVQVVGNTVFKQELSIAPGAVIEFKNTYGAQTIQLTVNGKLTIDGNKTSPVYVLADDTLNHDSWNVGNVTQVEVNRLVMRRINKGFYFKQVPIINTEKSRFSKMFNGVTVSESDSFRIQNCFFSNFEQNAISAFDTHFRVLKNIVTKCAQNGINAKNPRKALVQYNVFVRCNEYGIAYNLGGYKYINSRCNGYFNDFTNNRGHLFIGNFFNGKFNTNNLLNAKEFKVKAHLRGSQDTLDFRNNFWQEIIPNKIGLKIYDRRDVNNNISIRGPIIDFQNFKTKQIRWINNI